MIVVISATSAVAGGSVTYLVNLVPALAELDSRNRYIVLLSRYQKKVRLGLPVNFCIKRVDFPRPSLLWRLVWEQSYLPVQLWRWKADVLYATTDIAPVFAPCPIVLAVRNPNPYYKMAISRNRSTKFTLQRCLTRVSANKARKVIFVSYYSRDTIAPQLGIPLEKTEVVYHGINHNVFCPYKTFKNVPLKLREKINSLRPFVLCVSTINPHKNLEALLRAWTYMNRRLRKKYKLVIAGRFSSQKYFNKLHKISNELALEKEIIFLGEVSYQNVPFLYKCASAFVLPSLLETFGHPLIEAMAMKVPVVAARSTCIPEIVGDSALLFDPNNYEELSHNLERVLTDEALRKELISKGQIRASKFSWTETAEKTLSVLELAARNSLSKGIYM